MENRVEKALEEHFMGFGSYHRVMKLLKNHRFDLSESEILSLINRMDFSNPKLRGQNVYDEYFRYLVPVVEKYADSLKMVNTYGYVCDVYIDLLGETTNSLTMQTKCVELNLWNLMYGIVKKGLLLHPETIRLLQQKKSKPAKDILEWYYEKNPA